jgi:hypothetical protein
VCCPELLLPTGMLRRGEELGIFVRLIAGFCQSVLHIPVEELGVLGREVGVRHLVTSNLPR